MPNPRPANPRLSYSDYLGGTSGRSSASSDEGGLTSITRGLRSLSQNFAAGFSRDPANRNKYLEITQRNNELQRAEEQRKAEERQKLSQDRINALMASLEPYAETYQRSEGKPMPGLDRQLSETIGLMVANGLPEEDAAALYQTTKGWANIPAAPAEAKMENIIGPDGVSLGMFNIADPAVLAQLPPGSSIGGSTPQLPGETVQEWELRKAEAGRSSSSITIKNEGPIPQDYTAVRDAAGNLIGYQVVPNSKTDREMKAEAAAAEAGAEAKQTTATNVLTAIDNIESEMADAILPTTGAVGPYVANIGGTAAANIAASLETIESNIAFDKLQAMRDASKTGAALGSVTEREIDLLKSTVASLRQSQGEAQFKKNLAIVRKTFDEVINGKRDKKSGPDPLGLFE